MWTASCNRTEVHVHGWHVKLRYITLVTVNHTHCCRQLPDDTVCDVFGSDALSEIKIIYVV